MRNYYWGWRFSASFYDDANHFLAVHFAESLASGLLGIAGWQDQFSTQSADASLLAKENWQASLE